MYVGRKCIWEEETDQVEACYFLLKGRCNFAHGVEELGASNSANAMSAAACTKSRDEKPSGGKMCTLASHGGEAEQAATHGGCGTIAKTDEFKIPYVGEHGGNDTASHERSRGQKNQQHEHGHGQWRQQHEHQHGQKHQQHGHGQRHQRPENEHGQAQIA